MTGVSNPSHTVGFVDMDELNDTERITTVSIGLIQDAVQAAEVLSHGFGSETHIHLVEGDDDDDNPAVAFSTSRSGSTAVMVASRKEVQDND